MTKFAYFYYFQIKLEVSSCLQQYSLFVNFYENNHTSLQSPRKLHALTSFPMTTVQIIILCLHFLRRSAAGSLWPQRRALFAFAGGPERAVLDIPSRGSPLRRISQSRLRCDYCIAPYSRMWRRHFCGRTQPASRAAKFMATAPTIAQ